MIGKFVAVTEESKELRREKKLTENEENFTEQKEQFRCERCTRRNSFKGSDSSRSGWNLRSIRRPNFSGNK